MKVASHSRALVGAGSLGRDLRWGGQYAVHPFHYAAGGLAIGTTAYLVSPAVVPALRFGSMAATGLVPGGTEVILFLNRLKVLSLGPLEMAGTTVAAGVGLWNTYRLRREISSFARDRYHWLIEAADWSPADLRDRIRSKQKKYRQSQKRDGPPSLSQRTSKSPSFGKRRRRCKHRNKAGKQCLRPAVHSGRHRYR